MARFLRGQQPNMGINPNMQDEGFSSGYEVRDVRPRAFVRKLILTEARGYKDQYIRPLVTDLNNKDLMTFKDIIRNKELKAESRKYLEDEFVNKLSHTANLSSRPVAKAPIVGDWKQERFKFALEIEWRYPNKPASYIEYIQGYTDYLGYSKLGGNKGNLDENMRFFPNSILRVSKNRTRDGRIVTRVVGNYKLIKDETERFIDFKVGNLDTITAELIDLRRGEMDYLDSLNNVGDFTAPNIVPKETNIPVKLISELLDKVISVGEMVNEFESDMDTYSDLLRNMLANYTENIEFLKWLINLKQKDFYWFTLNELKILDPMIDKKTKVLLKAPMEQKITIVPDTMDTAEVYDSSLETRIAVTIQEAVSDLMTENYLEAISFTATNITTPKMEWTLHNVNAVIEGINPMPYVSKFMSEFYKFTWLPLTQHEEIGLTINVVSFLEADTVVTVQLEGGPEIVYRFPTFANTKFSPLIMDVKTLKLNTHNLGEIIDIGLTEVQAVKREAITSFMGNF